MYFHWKQRKAGLSRRRYPRMLFTNFPTRYTVSRKYRYRVNTVDKEGWQHKVGELSILLNAIFTHFQSFRRVIHEKARSRVMCRGWGADSPLECCPARCRGGGGKMTQSVSGLYYRVFVCGVRCDLIYGISDRRCQIVNKLIGKDR